MHVPTPRGVRRALLAPRIALTHAALTLAAPALALAPALPAAAAHAQPSDTAAVSTDPLFTSRDAWVAGAFVLGGLAMYPADRYFARRLQTPGAQERRFLRARSRDLRVLGAPGTVIIGVTMYGVGRAVGNERMADLGLHGTEALLIGAAVTGVGKMLAGRARPYVDTENPGNWGFGRGFEGDRYRSFPSGHSTMGFAAAAAVSAETARWWPKSRWYIGTAMYGGAALIGASRMYDNKHWASDVVIGAAIGTFAGRKVVRYHHSHPDNRVDRWLLGARVAPGAGGGWTTSLVAMPTSVQLLRRAAR